MDSSNYNSWTSKARLQEFKSKIETMSSSSSKRIAQLDEFKKTIFSSFRTTPQLEKETNKEGTPKNFSLGFSPKSTSMSKEFGNRMCFDDKKKINFEGKYSKKVFSGNKLAENEDLKYRPLFNNFSSPKILMNKESQLEEKNISDLITIGMLNKAVGILGQTEIDQLPRTYIRQLKQFCNEVLSQLNSD